jgi:hypothetical protein
MTDTDLIIAAHNGRLGYADGTYRYNSEPLTAADSQRVRALVFSGHLLLWGVDVKATREGRALAGLPQPRPSF